LSFADRSPIRCNSSRKTVFSKKCPPAFT
jgi:hypothetical protein